MFFFILHWYTPTDYRLQALLNCIGFSQSIGNALPWMSFSKADPTCLSTYCCWMNTTKFQRTIQYSLALEIWALTESLTHLANGGQQHARVRESVEPAFRRILSITRNHLRKNNIN